jgi:amidophosphoribosyltransferase
MCGIAGIHRRGDKLLPSINRLANELLLGIEERGRDSTGFLAMLDSGKVQTERGVCAARTFVKKRPTFSEDARTVLLHTRFATVGTVNLRNAHPVISGSCAAVHNGTIYNADELFRAFGIKRRAEVDSEIIPALISHAGWEQAADALTLMQGGMATAVVSSEHPTELLLARGRTYPLIAFVTDDFVVWASTERAIVSAWNFTFRSRPPAGQWMRLGERAVLRIAGDQIEYVEPAKPKPTGGKGKRKRKGSGSAATKPTARKRRKASKRAARPEQDSGPAVSGHRRRSPGQRDTRPTGRTGEIPGRQIGSWDDEIERDLMRAAGISRAEAAELLHGSGRETDPDEWEAALWSDISDDLGALMAAERGQL